MRAVARPARAHAAALLDWTAASKKARGVEPTSVPVKAGQQVGLLDVRLGGTSLATIPLLATRDVALPAQMMQAQITVPR